MYVAENSGAKVQQNTVPQELQDQMDKVITDAGLPVNDENRQKAQWLVGAGLPLTTDTLQQLAELDTIDYPVSEDALHRQRHRHSRRGNPLFMRIWHGRKYIRESHRNGTGLVLGCKWDVTAENLAARKQLEEIRLRMTAEVNVKLLQSDFPLIRPLWSS